VLVVARVDRPPQDVRGRPQVALELGHRQPTIRRQLDRQLLRLSRARRGVRRWLPLVPRPRLRGALLAPLAWRRIARPALARAVLTTGPRLAPEDPVHDPRLLL